MSTAKVILDGKEYELPVVVGSEGEAGIDITSFRSDSSAITLDPGFANTGSCQSAITFIDGEKGILRYRGYPIEQLAEQSSFIETSYLLIYGKLPTTAELEDFRHELTYHSLLHEDMKKFFEGFPPNAHPMAVLSSMVASLSSYYPVVDEEREQNIIRLMAKVKTITAYAYKKSVGQPFVYPLNHLTFCENFLRMMVASERPRLQL